VTYDCFAYIYSCILTSYGAGNATGSGTGALIEAAPPACKAASASLLQRRGNYRPAHLMSDEPCRAPRAGLYKKALRPSLAAAHTGPEQTSSPSFLLSTSLLAQQLSPPPRA